jgi:hypothetical protein
MERTRYIFTISNELSCLRFLQVDSYYAGYSARGAYFRN